jgi:hypothetical protein
MKSHVCEFKVSELIRVVARPLVAVGAFALAMHLGARLGLLPAPRPTLDVDRTVLIQKAEASRTRQDAEILLLGDSSCLMDVSAPLLTERLGRPVLNLGTLSYLSFGANALLLRHYAQANPGRLRAVVVLMNPEALRLPHFDEWQNFALRSFLDGADFRLRRGFSDWITGVLGVHIFQGRLLARALPRPLPGSFGRRYGFSDDLERYLKQNRGTALDPESKPAIGRAEYRLASYLKSASAVVREAVPPGAKLFVGITPIPRQFAGPAYPARQTEMLHEWSGWLKADGALTNLPAVLPDNLFAQKTHLNAAGQRAYTEQLAEALAPLLR